MSRISYGALLRRARTVPERPSSAARGYDRQWRKTRERVLTAQPLCVDCEAAGRVTPATEVHHRVKLAAAPARKHDPENLVPLCSECHGRRTAAGE
jgi:5-methylcytosine-specific restriction enzyme A